MDGAVVVLYNPGEADYKNILTYSDKVDFVYIIDNSPESHLADISKVIKIDQGHLNYEHHPENLGLCKGMNYGIEKLYEKGCMWAFTMNSDSYFVNDVVGIFRHYVKKNDCNDIVLLAPLYNFDRHKAVPYTGSKVIKRAMMSGNYVNIELFKKLNGFLEVLFVDGLDNEFCIRARKNGYKIVECGQAIMEHMPCQTRERKIFGKTILYGYDSPKRYYGHARSLAYIVKKYKTTYELMFYFYKLFKIIFLFDNKKEFLQQYWKGTKDGIAIKL